MLAVLMSVPGGVLFFPAGSAASLRGLTNMRMDRKLSTNKVCHWQKASLERAYALVQKQSKSPADEEKCMLKLAATLALEDKTGEAQSL